MFVQASEATPLINRSGHTFHVSLSSGPDPRPIPSGGFRKDQVVCNFTYVDDRIGPERKSFTVYVVTLTENRQELLSRIESAAEAIAEMLEEGRSLEPAYTSTGNLLISGTPK